MARKNYDGGPFVYRIQILDRDSYESERRRRQVVRRGFVHASDSWRRLRHEDAIMFFVHQILKYKREIKRPWYCYYEVFGYGAPGSKEFLCSKTSMIASTIRPESALFYRQHYAKLIRKSQEILIWLLGLPFSEYTQELHHYLLRFIIIDRPHKDRLNAYQKNREAAISRALR